MNKNKRRKPLRRKKKRKMKVKMKKRRKNQSQLLRRKLRFPRIRRNQWLTSRKWEVSASD